MAKIIQIPSFQPSISPMKRVIGRAEIPMIFRLAERLEKNDHQQRTVMVTSNRMDVLIDVPSNKEAFAVMVTKWLDPDRRGWFGYKSGYKMEVLFRGSQLSLTTCVASIDELEEYPQEIWWKPEEWTTADAK